MTKQSMINVVLKSHEKNEFAFESNNPILEQIPPSKTYPVYEGIAHPAIPDISLGSHRLFSE